jgi:hypothetical protein
MNREALGATVGDFKVLFWEQLQRDQGMLPKIEALASASGSRTSPIFERSIFPAMHKKSRTRVRLG